MEQNNKTLEDFLLVTYPRTGSHFLQSYLDQQTGFKITKTHFPRWSKHKKVITIIRDPEDTLRSAFTMSKHYATKTQTEFDWEADRENHVFTNPGAYVDFFEYVADHADVFIDYNTLINDPYSVCKFLSNYIGIEIRDKQEYVQYLKDEEYGEYLVSSTTSEHYKSMDVSWVDMTRHYEIYNKIIKQKTI
jgi:hypothetical protein